MTINRIESVFNAVADLDAACRPYEHLGLRLSAVHDHRRTLHVGGPVHRFAVHFLADPGQNGPLGEAFRTAVEAGRSFFAVGLCLKDLQAVVRQLASRDLPGMPFRADADDLVWLPLHEQAGTDIVLRGEPHDASPVPAHPFPLRRLDHLAIVTHDLEAKTRFWTEVLGVPVAGEVTTPALVIRQLRIGDAVLELLGPSSADSPIGKRPPGLVSMASWEVADLEAAVAHARAAGFTVAEPAIGVLPGTRIATVQGSELAGVNMQLLEYT